MAASTACTVPKAQGARQWRVSSKMVTMMHGSSRPLVPALVARRTHAAQVCASNPTRVQNVPRLAPATPWRPPLVHWRLSPCAAASSSGAPQDADAQFLGIPSLTWQKVIPLGVTFFGILFNYTLLRNTKVRAMSYITQSKVSRYLLQPTNRMYWLSPRLVLVRKPSPSSRPGSTCHQPLPSRSFLPKYA